MKFEQDRVIWSNRLDNVTMRAAVFCISLNLFNRCLGRPYDKELQLSSLELINACTKIWEVSSLKYFLILAMFLKWYWQETHILLTWSVKSRHWSIITPRFRADGLGWIFSSTTWINSRERLQRIFKLMRTSSVLSWLSLDHCSPSTINVVCTAFDTTLSQREIIATVSSKRYIQLGIISV